MSIYDWRSKLVTWEIMICDECLLLTVYNFIRKINYIVEARVAPLEHLATVYVNKKGHVPYSTVITLCSMLCKGLCDPSVCLSVCLFICLSVCLSVCL